MSPAHLVAVSTTVPDSSIVFDHFHVIKLFNEELTELRRDLNPTSVWTSFPKSLLRGPDSSS